MEGVRGNHATPGEFRRSQDWIGPPGCTLSNATYVPPPPGELMDCLAAWEKFLHGTRLPPLVQAALAHSQFEAIHDIMWRSDCAVPQGVRCCESEQASRAMKVMVCARRVGFSPGTGDPSQATLPSMRSWSVSWNRYW